MTPSIMNQRKLAREARERQGELTRLEDKEVMSESNKERRPIPTTNRSVLKKIRMIFVKMKLSIAGIASGEIEIRSFVGRSDNE